MKKQIKYLSILLLMLISLKVNSQQSTNALIKQISPLTPNAASLGKFGDIPVSLYTGIPNIQIPLYEIVVKDFKLPISLSYHAGGGIKVNDIASWVGSGWTLNAGGIISRQQRGIGDELMFEKKSSYNNDIQTILSSTSSDVNKANAATNMYNSSLPRFDLESDIFSLNAGNLLQKFLMQDRDHIYTIPSRKLFIKAEGGNHYRGNNGNLFDRWRVTDENGVQYIFGKTIDGSKSEMEIYNMQKMCNSDESFPDDMISSWYLNEIILPSGESIKFKYEYYSYCTDNDIERTFNYNWILTSSSVSAINYTKALRIQEITFPKGRIEFIPVPNSTRSDLHNDKVLEYINVYSVQGSSNQLIKSFKLTTNNPSGIHTVDDLNFRLYLRSVEEVALDGTKNKIYSFDYYSYGGLGLPARNSSAQDLWGYANSSYGGNGLIPSYIFRDSEGRVIGYYDGINRSINTDVAKVGLLQRINYPTGGYSEFEYGSNIARGIVETKQTGSQTTKSINPLYILDNMMSTGIENKSAGISLYNNNGYDKGSVYFDIINPMGVTINIDGYMTWGNPSEACPLISPTGTSGSFYDCVPLSFEKKDQATGSYSNLTSNVYFNTTYFLPKGNYKAKLEWKDLNDGVLRIGSWFRVQLKWQDYNPPANPTVDENTERTVGGLRVSKITDYDPIKKQSNVRNFNYAFNSDDPEGQGTSGYIQNAPLYYYVNTDPVYAAGIWHDCSFGCFCLTSNVNSSILQTNGGLVGYKKVTTDFGANGEAGRTVTYFLSPKDYPDDNLIEAQKWPFPSTTSFDWRRGLVDKEISYKKANGAFIPVKTTQNVYQFNSTLADQNYLNLPNIKIYRYCVGYFLSDPLFGGQYKLYNTQTESFYLKESTSTETNILGSVSSRMTYEQSPKNLNVSSSTLASSIKQITTCYVYASDIFDNQTLGSDLATLAIRNMVNNYNMITTPIEKYVVTTRSDGTKYITGGTLTIYYPDKPLPKEIYTLELSSPLPFSSFTPCKIDPSGNFVKDTRYKPQVTFDLYDANHNLQEEHKEGDIHTSYIWGYSNTYPVVKIEGIDYGNISSSIKTNISDRTFTTSSSYASVKIDVDYLKSQLATLLSDSRYVVTFYTYAPLKGVTSQTDTNGLTTYYEYDDFGRLKVVRDKDGNILKTFEYHYNKSL